MRIFWLALLFAALPVFAQDSYMPGQMGAYMSLCGGGRTAAMCKMYLAGYRAGLYDLQRQAQAVNRYSSEKCQRGGSQDDCAPIDAVSISMSMFEGCKLEGKMLSADQAHQKLVSYIAQHPESLNGVFSDVYQAAIADSYPCK